MPGPNYDPIEDELNRRGVISTGNRGGGGMTPFEQRRRDDYRFLANLTARERASQDSGLANLIRATENSPEVQQAILERRGIQARPGPGRSARIFQEAIAREQARAMFRDPSKTGAGGAPLPADVVGSIGTPEFGQRLRDAASSGQVDRQGLQTLYDLDRKERELSRKSNQPGKMSAQQQKLREMARLGVPLTEDVVMGVYSPGLAGSRREAIAADRAAGKEPRLYSLGQLAGIDDAPASPETGAPPAQDEDRRRRLRGLLTGGAY